MRGVNSLVAFVIGNAVQHFRISPALIISENDFSHKPEFRVFAFTEASYSFKEIKLNTVGGVKAYAVYFEFLYPVVYSVYEMIAYAGISKIELYKVIMTVPAFIPKIVSAGTFPSKFRFWNHPQYCDEGPFWRMSSN